MSAGLGAAGQGGRLRLALVFGAFEGLMPVAGALVGAGLGAHLARLGVWLAVTLLLALGIKEIVEAWREWGEDGDDDDDGHAGRPDLTGWALVPAGLSVSMDELAAGFAIGSGGLPLGLLLPALALQAAVFTVIGLRAGAWLRRVAGRYGDLAAGVAFVAVAIALAAGLR